MSDQPTGFYEDDEPAEKVRAAFERGEKGLTAKTPRDLNQLAASIVSEATERRVPIVGAIHISTDDLQVSFEAIRLEAGAISVEAPSQVTISA